MTLVVLAALTFAVVLVALIANCNVYMALRRVKCPKN